MVKIFLKRLVIATVTIFLIATFSFFLLHALPGKPFGSLSSMNAEMQNRLIGFYNLDKPIVEQYFHYLCNLLKGDLGYSMRYVGQSVNDIILEAFPYSAWLGIQAYLISFPLGIILGVVASMNYNKPADYGILLLSTLGVVLPTFIVGTILQYFFAVKLNLLPSATWTSFRHTILPTLTLAIGPIATKTRTMRGLMLEVSSEDYMRTARAKGLSPFAIIVRHQIKNAILPMISTSGVEFASILMGSMIVEQIFAIPGLGAYYVSSIQNLDYTMTLGLTLFFAIWVILTDLVVDVFYGIIDPRVKVYKKEL